MQPLKNTSELADIALRNYYEAISSSSRPMSTHNGSSRSMSTRNESDDAPFYKDISPRRPSKSRNEIDPEVAREKYANSVLEDYESTKSSISKSYRNVLEV